MYAISYHSSLCKEIFFTKTSEHHTSEPHVIEVYTPICPHMLWPYVLQLNLYTWRARSYL